jgi:adenosylhomocysteine nucleosidase
LRPLGIVAALAEEADILGADRKQVSIRTLSDGTLLAISGIGAAAATQAAESLVATGVSALLSWGMAGALDPKFAAGDLLLPRQVIAPDGTGILTTPAWRERLGANLPTEIVPSGDTLLTNPTAIASVADKAAAWRATGAGAVDMETLAIGRIAIARELPFIAVRVIVDTASDLLPRAVMAATRDGQVRIGLLLRGLVLAPSDIGGLLRLARRYRAAKRTLAEVARVGLAQSP